MSWLPWKGGECPVSKWSRVDIKHRNGKVYNDINCDIVYWEHTPKGNPGDIIAYRINHD